jgi:hypothetical protein
MDGLRPLIEIAHWTVIYHVPPIDRDDVEQEIVLKLMRTVEKYGNQVGIDVDNLSSRGRNYLNKVAVNRRNDYFARKSKAWGLRHIEESDGGEWAGGTWLVSHDGDLDARLDSIATLATLSERLIGIGHKILNGEKLSGADQAYRVKQLRKLLYPELNCRVSAWERKRILQLYREDMCVHKIAVAMGRTDRTILRVLGGRRLPLRRNWLPKERDERIRHAYFTEEKSIKQIAREFHHDRRTVRRAIKTNRPWKPQLGCPYVPG